MHAPSEPIALGEDFEVNDLNLPLAAVYARPRKGSNKTSFLPLKDACACCTHTEQVDEPETIGQCSEHLFAKSRFSIRNICCDSEVRLIERIIAPLQGVESLSINSFQKTCIISHCPSCCSPDFIVSKLNGAGLGATLLGQGHLETDAAPNFREVWQEHARYVIVIISLLLLVLGVLCTGLPVSLGQTFLLLALLLGLCGILRESAVSLMQGNMEISSLVVLAALAAAMQGESADAALVVLLFNISKAVESVAFSRVSSALRAVLQLQAARTIHLVGGKAVPISELRPGDTIALRPGEECPADGLVSKGSASCSEAALSGESRPVQKQKGDLLSSGAVMLNGYLEVTSTTLSSQSSLSQIEAQVEEAQTKRTERQLLIQRFARWWTPSIIVLVLLIAFVVPIFLGDFERWGRRALVMLLTACPCAIVLGAPLATTCAIAAAASQGLLLKRPEVVEKLPCVQVLGVDKTGTLTKGELSVLHVETFAGSENALSWAAAMELHSCHPIAAAVISKAVGCVGQLPELPSVEEFQLLPGVGIRGTISGCQVLLGNEKSLDVARAEPLAHAQFLAFRQSYQHHITVAMLIDGELCLGLALNDTIREGCRQLLQEFEVMGLKSAMLTGDSLEAGGWVAETLSLEGHFAMSPEEKMNWVTAHEDEGCHVLMLGDGINDATALTAAHVGVAMGETGAPLAAQSADIVMMTDKLYRLPQCVRLCRYAVRIERLNIAIPVILKLLQTFVAMVVDLKLWIVVLGDLGTLLLALLLGVSILSPRFWDQDNDLTVGKSRRFRRRLEQYEQFQ